MPSGKYQWMNQVKAVEREHTATRFATEHLLNAARQDPTALEGDLRVRDVVEAASRLEGTYTIRLFAEFETGLRIFWTAWRQKEPPSRTRDLLEGVAAIRKIPDETLENAHTVREYRNGLVHERDESGAPLPLAQSRGFLCLFLSFLPAAW